MRREAERTHEEMTLDWALKGGPESDTGKGKGREGRKRRHTGTRGLAPMRRTGAPRAALETNARRDSEVSLSKMWEGHQREPLGSVVGRNVPSGSGTTEHFLQSG